MYYKCIERIKAGLNIDGVVEEHVGGVCRKPSATLAQHLLYPLTHAMSAQQQEEPYSSKWDSL